MTNHYEITKLYHKGELLHKCSHSDCFLYKLGQEWVYHGGIPDDYKNISHGLCPEHLQIALDSIEDCLGDEK